MKPSTYMQKRNQVYLSNVPALSNLEQDFVIFNPLLRNIFGMMKKRFRLFALAVIGGMVLFPSCVMLKEYEKVNINDPDMALGDKKMFQFETTFQAYREAAAGANGGKTGGGCGCN
ncbi:MAG: DUF4266 domain-containing protein [Tenuifilaceae bacterium]|jgi:hypothetical protein|nr:DUF4266 domain-containing protein [Tenuifilaceae bacterium]